MCHPAAFVAIPAALEIGKTVLDYSNQEQRSQEQTRAAQESYQLTLEQLTQRGVQETKANAGTLLGIGRQSRAAQATANVSAGAAGVAGSSVEQLLAGIQRDALTASTASNRQLSDTLAQLSMEKKGATALMQNRINEAAPPNPFASLLRIGGAAAGAGADYARLLPK
jgi:hypothetical protein